MLFGVHKQCGQFERLVLLIAQSHVTIACWEAFDRHDALGYQMIVVAIKNGEFDKCQLWKNDLRNKQMDEIN